jgi:hypothetical protein
MPAEMAVEQRFSRIAGQPGAEERTGIIGLAGLVVIVGEGVRCVGVPRLVGDRALDPRPSRRPVAELRQCHRVVAVEPPVVAVVRRQRREEIQLILLSAGNARGADQARLVGGEADDQRVARPGPDMPAYRGECVGRPAADQKAEDLDMAGVPFPSAARASAVAMAALVPGISPLSCNARARAACASAKPGSAATA